MKSDRTRRRRLLAIDGAYAVEERVLMSAIGRSMPTSRASVDVSALHDHTKPQVEPLRARPAVHAAHHSPDVPAVSTSKRWAWLAGTYWYVPAPNVPAVLYNASSGGTALVSDQTVFHITGYNNGYFRGDVVTQLGSTPASSSTMIGSVTPEGQVLLTFTKTSTDSSPTITQGFGKMTRRFGQWTMENQMFTSPSETLQIGHWAYMLQTRPGKPSWEALPSVGVSVPTFLSQ